MCTVKLMRKGSRVLRRIVRERNPSEHQNMNIDRLSLSEHLHDVGTKAPGLRRSTITNRRRERPTFAVNCY